MSEGIWSQSGDKPVLSLSVCLLQETNDRLKLLQSSLYSVGDRCLFKANYG